MTLSMVDVIEHIKPHVTIDLTGRRITVGAVTSEHPERRDLVRDLGTFIYTHFHVGHHHNERLEAGANRDMAYEEALSERYASWSTTRRVPVLSTHQDDVIVQYLGLRVRAPRPSVDVTGSIADLTVPLISPALSPGFALARGPVDLAEADKTLRVYFGADDRDHATETFHAVLRVLRARRRWHAKVTSQQNLYPRSDAVTVYLHTAELDAVKDLLQATRHVRTGQVPRSQFVLPLGPGVSCAWDPDGRGVSFGQHRSRVVAQVLMAQAEGSWDPSVLAGTCESKGIDPHNVWRNPTSPEPCFLHRAVQEALATAMGNH